MESLNVKNINDEKIFNVIDPNGQGEVVNRIRPISISINQKAETINNETDSTINLSVYWNDTWKSILDLTFDESLRQEYGKLVEDLTKIQKDIDMKQYKDAETKTNDFLKYVANLSSKYTAIPEKAVVAKTKNDFVKITADKNSVKVAISDKLLNFMLKKYAKVDNLDYTKSNECFSTSKFNCLANNYDIYYHSPEIFQKQAYMTVVKDNKVVGSYKVNYDQFSKFASKFMLTPQKLGYSKDRLAGYMKTAEVVMQNIFFDSVDEAKEWQEMVDKKKKEQATTPEGEEETTETTTTETKTEMGEGKSESPVKGDGGLARPSEDFASDEIPESEPRQQDQQGGGQNLGASRRLNLLKKKAAKEYVVTDEWQEKNNQGMLVTKKMEEKLTSKELIDFAKERWDADYEDEEITDLDSAIKWLKDNGFKVTKNASSIKKKVEKKAKVGYNAKPENREEEIAIDLADDFESAASLALEKAGKYWGGYSGEEERKERVEIAKKAIEPMISDNFKKKLSPKIYNLMIEHLTDINSHILVSAIKEIMGNKQASKKVKLNKKADTEFFNEWTQVEENLDKDDIQMIRDRVEIEKGFGPSVYSKEELAMMNNILKVLNTPQDVNKLSQEEKKFIQDKMEVELVYARDGVYDDKQHKILKKVFQNFVPKNREELKQFIKKQLEPFHYRFNVWKDNHLKDLEGIVTEEEAKQIYDELVEEKNKQSSKAKRLNKQARTVNSKQDIKQILKDKNAIETRNYGDFVSAIRENKTPVETIKAYGKKKTAGGYDEYVLVVYESGAYFYTELSNGKRVDEKYYKFENVSKKALYGDVQEQDIVPAKTETKVYLQSSEQEDADKYIKEDIEGTEEYLKKYFKERPDLFKAQYGVETVEEALKLLKEKNPNWYKKAEETIEEKIEMAENDNVVKSVISVGDIVAIKIDNCIYEDMYMYAELIGKPLVLMENDKDDINKVIVEQTEYPFQRMSIDKDKIMQYAELKGADVVIEDEDGDEMITTFEELPVVAKQCKIKSIHKAATKKKANLAKKAINSLEDVAGLIDTIWSDYDWYEYADAVEVGEKSHYEDILADVQKDEKGAIEGILKLIEEDDNGYTAPEVEQLKEYYNAKFGGK